MVLKLISLMTTRNKKIILVDYSVNSRSSKSENLTYPPESTFVFDPVDLFSEVDWTKYDEEVQVINQIYSRLFDEVVIDKKTMVCFWPLSEKYGNDWFELTNLFTSQGVEWEIQSQELFMSSSYELSFDILRAWKKFVYFIWETLFEDLQLNEQIEEVATLTGKEGSIVLFKINQEGRVKYSYSASNERVMYNSQIEEETESGLAYFESFDALLTRLLEDLDLQVYSVKFYERSFEKAYYNHLSKDLKSKNLIKSWLESFSLN